jgi:hypothetical protein
MKKNLLFALCSLLCVFDVFAQNYYHLRSDGELPEGYYLDKIYESTKTILLNEPSNDVMSSIGRMPFAFNYYGQSYTSYRVSDNGYLSFDTTDTDSKEPSVTLPKNSIIGFWKDFKLQKLPEPNQGVGIQVFSYTVGKAPNRKHIVQYFGLSLVNNDFSGPISNASIFAFAIIFHEGSKGRFDIVFTPYGDKNQKAVIGCTNSDNSKQKLLNDSTNYLPFQFSFENKNFIVYQFIYGNQPQYDLSLKSVNVNSVYQTNAVVNFSGVLFNSGKQAVSSLNLNYSINQGDTIVYPLSGLNIKPNGENTYSFLHPLSWTSGANGSLNSVNFWLSDPNGLPDGDSVNSHFSKLVLRNLNNYTAPRRVLLEEGTGAWCGYCPDAHVTMKKAKEQFGDKVINVSYHNDDSMSIVSGDSFLNTYFSSYPDAILDRKINLGSTSTWLNELSSRINGNSPVELFIEMKSYNVSNRTITYTVRVKFSDYWYGNLNIGSIVTEDRVRGNASPNLWSQNNYYSKFHSGGAGGANHPLYNENEYMDGYIHNSVVKAMPGGVWGVSGLIPQYITPNSVYSQTFSYVLPPAVFVNYSVENNTEYCSTRDDSLYNEGRNIPAYIRLIGYVSANDSNELYRPVLNSIQENLWNLVGIKDVFVNNSLSVYPNPAHHTLYINWKNQNDSQIVLKIQDITGKVIKTIAYDNLTMGDQILIADIADLNSGFYTVSVSTPSGVFTSKFIKE